MKFHPYSEVFPLLTGDAFDGLVADIKAHGLREKIWTYEGKILDGRNRFLACKEAKVKSVSRAFRGTAQEALAFVISMNVARRHLNESQRAVAANKIATLSHGGDRKSDQAANLPTQAQAAEALNVSERSVRTARKVEEKGSAALQKAVASGDISISKAASVVGLPKSEQLPAAILPKAREPEPFDNGMPAYTPDDAEEEAALERATAEIDKSMAAVMESDDRFPALMAEIKRLAGLLSIAEASRDHYQNQGGQAVRLLKARDREIESLKKKLAKAEADNEKLTERISIMEEAA